MSVSGPESVAEQRISDHTAIPNSFFARFDGGEEHRRIPRGQPANFYAPIPRIASPVPQEFGDVLSAL